MNERPTALRPSFWKMIPSSAAIRPGRSAPSPLQRDTRAVMHVPDQCLLSPIRAGVVPLAGAGARPRAARRRTRCAMATPTARARAPEVMAGPTPTGAYRCSAGGGAAPGRWRAPCQVGVAGSALGDWVTGAKNHNPLWLCAVTKHNRLYVCGPVTQSPRGAAEKSSVGDLVG